MLLKFPLCYCKFVYAVRFSLCQKICLNSNKLHFTLHTSSIASSITFFIDDILFEIGIVIVLFVLGLGLPLTTRLKSYEKISCLNTSRSFILFLLSKCSIDPISFKNSIEYSFLMYSTSMMLNSLPLNSDNFFFESSLLSTPSSLARMIPKLQTSRALA